jgi:hypothetical protein
MLMVLATRPMSDLRFQRAKYAWFVTYQHDEDSKLLQSTLYAAFSYRSSPVIRLNAENSKIKEPAPAVPVEQALNCAIVNRDRQD